GAPVLAGHAQRAETRLDEAPDLVERHDPPLLAHRRLLGQLVEERPEPGAGRRVVVGGDFDLGMVRACGRFDGFRPLLREETYVPTRSVTTRHAPSHGVTRRPSGAARASAILLGDE